MTGWCFNLRSGSYSDSEDDTEPDNTHTSNSIPPNATDTNTSPQNPGSGSPDTASTTRQNETSRELKELFGGFEDEAILNYKPNPWNIAKMNANARASAPGLAKPAKPALKHVEIKAAGNKRFFFSKAKGAGGKLGNIARSSAKVRRVLRMGDVVDLTRFTPFRSPARFLRKLELLKNRYAILYQPLCVAKSLVPPSLQWIP